MNIKTITIRLLPAVLFLIIVSCGNDNLVSVANNNGTVIFQKDSLAVWLNPSECDSGRDSVYFSAQEYGVVKVDFTVQSNADSTHSLGYWGIYTNATPKFPYVPVILGSINEHVSIDMNFSTVHETYFSFGLRFYVEDSEVPYYARIKDIKIIKK